MTDRRTRLEHALRETRGYGGNVYAFAFGYLAGCIEHADQADTFDDARTHLTHARELIALIEPDHTTEADTEDHA
jgi:hypothetical protein